MISYEASEIVKTVVIVVFLVVMVIGVLTGKNTPKT